MEGMDGDAMAPAVEEVLASASGVQGGAGPAGHAAVDMRPALLIIGLVIVASLVVEGLSWLLVYRTADYKRLIKEVEEQHKQFAKLRSAPASDKDLPRKRKKLDDAMLKTSREFAFTVRFKTGALTFGLLMLVYRLVTTRWAGMAVALLPFEPPAIMHRLTHATLEGTNMRECSALFIYVLCGLAVRSNITKFLNLGPNRAISASTTPQAVMDKDKYK